MSQALRLENAEKLGGHEHISGISICKVNDGCEAVPGLTCGSHDCDVPLPRACCIPMSWNGQSGSLAVPSASMQTSPMTLRNTMNTAKPLSPCAQLPLLCCRNTALSSRKVSCGQRTSVISWTSRRAGGSCSLQAPSRRSWMLLTEAAGRTQRD